MQNVLVIFQASEETTEGLALALGLGAVQRGANIRLRHLHPSAKARLAHQSYGTLKPADLAWAQGIAILLEAEDPAALAELAESVRAASETADFSGKWAYVFAHPQAAVSVQAVRTLFPAPVQWLAEGPGEPAATAAYLTGVGQRMADLA